MTKLNYLFTALLIFGFLSSANAAIKVSPTMIEMDANKTQGNYLTSSFDVQGGQNETIRFKIYPEYFKITSKGTMEIFEKSEASDSLIKNTRFVPSEFTLQNGKVQKVRLTVANLKQLPDGESRMVMFLEDVAVKEVVLANPYKNVTTKLLVKTRVGIPVYVDKGRYIKNANIQDLKIGKKDKELISTLKLISSGNSKVRYQGKAQIIKDKQLIDEYHIKNNVIGSKNTLLSEEPINLKKVKENGDYILRVILSYEDEKGKQKSLIKETSFKVDGMGSSKI